MSQYVLPALPYPTNALEPYISRRIVEVHHGGHHATYVNSANVAVDRLHDARKRQDFSALPSLERSLAFNLSGHILHSIYWRNLTPKGGGEPTGDFADTLKNDFGSFAMFRRHMIEAASSIMGSGWSALVWEPLGGKLLVTQIYDHQSNQSQSGVPIMVLDAWEHVFYLQYENRKEEYFEGIWNLWNWKDIAQRYASARNLGVMLPDAVRA